MVHYRDAADAGGSLRVGQTIANHLDPQRVGAEMVFAYGVRGPVAARAGVPCHFIGADGPKDLSAWVRARALFKELRPDLIHFQDGVVWLRMALLGSPYKKAVHVHGRYRRVLKTRNLNDPPFRTSQMLRLYLKSTDAQICINNGARESLLNLGWISRETSYVVYNGIDASRFCLKSDSGQARAQLGLPKDALLLGMVCRLVWEKGCADLLSIIERLPARWHGVICGDGPQRQQLEQACKRRDLVDRIHFIGTRNDVAPVYAALDAYAFLSRYEPFGLVLAEAMSAGVPIFGIEGDGEYKEAEYPLITGDNAELVSFDGSRDHEDGLPVQILDEIAHRIANFGRCPDLFYPMIERARVWANTCFGAPVQAAAMMCVYEHLCRHPANDPVQLAQLYDSTQRNALKEIAGLQSNTQALLARSTAGG
jgi:glycosyltransferase involved in cell wall biosynthesis